MNQKITNQIELDFNKDEQKTVKRELLSIQEIYVDISSYNFENTCLAILKLAEGELTKVKYYVSAAKKDFRDVIMWAMEDK